MKKVIVIFIMFSLLVGCGYSPNYIDPEDRCIATSVGVKKQNDAVVCFVETTDKDGIKKYNGKGINLSEAIDAAASKISGDIIFSQCPIILVDDGIDNEIFGQIFNLCISEYDFSLSIQLINCNVPQIYEKKSTENSLGYEIIKTLNYTDKSKKINEYGRLANILNDNENDATFRLPHLIINDGALVIDGLTVYKDSVKTKFIDIKVVEDEGN